MKVRFVSWAFLCFGLSLQLANLTQRLSLFVYHFNTLNVSGKSVWAVNGTRIIGLFPCLISDPRAPEHPKGYSYFSGRNVPNGNSCSIFRPWRPLFGKGTAWFLQMINVIPGRSLPAPNFIDRNKEKTLYGLFVYLLKSNYFTLRSFRKRRLDIARKIERGGRERKIKNYFLLLPPLPPCTGGQ